MGKKHRGKGYGGGGPVPRKRLRKVRSYNPALKQPFVGREEVRKPPDVPENETPEGFAARVQDARKRSVEPPTRGGVTKKQAEEILSGLSQSTLRIRKTPEAEEK